MAYDRYDTRDSSRDERSRWSDDRSSRGDRNSGRGGDDRGFFERAGDEIASWFGDDDAERRRRGDQRIDERHGGQHDDHRERNWQGDRMSGRNDDRHSDRERERMSGRDEDRGFRDRGWERGQDQGRGRGYSAAERDYNPSWRRELGGSDRDRNEGRDRGYRPMAGDYSRGTDHESDQYFAVSGVGRGERGVGGYDRSNDRSERGDRDRSQSEWSRDPYRRTSRAGTSDQSDKSRHEDPHYASWKQRHVSDLDRDYDDYRRENQSRFEDDFSSWRDKRQQKRGMLGQVREHMEVVGNDQKHVGTVDKVAGDRIILTKSDPDSGGAHHSLGCSEVDRVEGNKVILDCSAEQARQRWHDESRNRALFERDQGQSGPHVLGRSFEGTYR